MRLKIDSEKLTLVCRAHYLASNRNSKIASLVKDLMYLVANDNNCVAVLADLINEALVPPTKED